MSKPTEDNYRRKSGILKSHNTYNDDHGATSSLAPAMKIGTKKTRRISFSRNSHKMEFSVINIDGEEVTQFGELQTERTKYLSDESNEHNSKRSSIGGLFGEIFNTTERASTSAVAHNTKSSNRAITQNDETGVSLHSWQKHQWNETPTQDKSRLTRKEKTQYFDEDMDETCQNTFSEDNTNVFLSNMVKKTQYFDEDMVETCQNTFSEDNTNVFLSNMAKNPVNHGTSAFMEMTTPVGTLLHGTGNDSVDMSFTLPLPSLNVYRENDTMDMTPIVKESSGQKSGASQDMEITLNTSRRQNEPDDHHDAGMTRKFLSVLNTKTISSTAVEASKSAKAPQQVEDAELRRMVSDETKNCLSINSKHVINNMDDVEKVRIMKPRQSSFMDISTDVHMQANATNDLAPNNNTAANESIYDVAMSTLKKATSNCNNEREQVCLSRSTVDLTLKEQTRGTAPCSTNDSLLSMNCLNVDNTLLNLSTLQSPHQTSFEQTLKRFKQHKRRSLIKQEKILLNSSSNTSIKYQSDRMHTPDRRHLSEELSQSSKSFNQTFRSPIQPDETYETLAEITPCRTTSQLEDEASKTSIEMNAEKGSVRSSTSSVSNSVNGTSICNSAEDNHKMTLVDLMKQSILFREEMITNSTTPFAANIEQHRQQMRVELVQLMLITQNNLKKKVTEKFQQLQNSQHPAATKLIHAISNNQLNLIEGTTDATRELIALRTRNSFHFTFNDYFNKKMVEPITDIANKFRHAKVEQILARIDNSVSRIEKGNVVLEGECDQLRQAIELVPIYRRRLDEVDRLKQELNASKQSESERQRLIVDAYGRLIDSLERETTLINKDLRYLAGLNRQAETYAEKLGSTLRELIDWEMEDNYASFISMKKWNIIVTVSASDEKEHHKIKIKSCTDDVSVSTEHLKTRLIEHLQSIINSSQSYDKTNLGRKLKQIHEATYGCMHFDALLHKLVGINEFFQITNVKVSDYSDGNLLITLHCVCRYISFLLKLCTEFPVCTCLENEVLPPVKLVEVATPENAYPNAKEKIKALTTLFQNVTKRDSNFLRYLI